MKTKILPILMLLPALMAMTANAAGEGASAVAGPGTVIVPFDAKKPLAGQKPAQVYVPYGRFVELWEAAKVNKRGIPREIPDERYVLGSSRYDAILQKDVMIVKGTIDLMTFGDDWVSVPLSFKQAKIGSMTLDGLPAPVESGKVAIEKAGPHHIEMELEIPVRDSTARIWWGIPKTAGTLVSLTLPDRQMKATVQPGDGVVERMEGDRKIVTAALGGAERVDITLDSSVGLATMTQAALAKITATLGITPDVESLHSEYEFSFPESRQDHFTVLLDNTLALVKLDVPGLKSWKLSMENGRQSLEIVLTEPARESFKFSVDAERSVAEVQRHFPFLSAAANRIEQTSAIFSRPDLHVAPQPSAAFRQVSFPAEAQPGLRLVAAFSSTEDNAVLDYGAQAAKPANKAEISYVYQVNHSKIELLAALKLRQDGVALFDVEIGLPPDFVVEAVESDRLKDWWRDGDTLHVRFHGVAPEMTPLVLHLVKQYKTVPDELAIKPLVLPGAWEVEGNGIIAASRSVKAAMTLANAKEMDPQDAATDFRILAPMERKRGFSFKGRDFSASVKLETLPVRLAAEWVMSAQAHESSVSVSIHAELTVRQGSATGVSFRLPASAPEARVTGENVRETTSTLEGDWRIYRVSFQQELADKAAFTTDIDLPEDGKTALPAFELLDVERVEAFVIVDNVSEYEMSVTPSGLDIAQGSQIPFLPEISRNARLFRVLPGWSLQIDMTRLEKEAGRSAFVAWAELTTAIRSDGGEWHRASYHLQNRSLQFLPVKLPDGAELAGVSVAGENVRADRGKVDGKDVLLIPLIKTKPGDMSYDVELVYRKNHGRGLWAVSRNTLADPEVVGITVERTLWNLYVPEELDAGSFGGNMEQVLAEVNRTEKLQGMLDELKALNGLISLGRSSAVSRNAGENFRILAKKLEESSAATEDHAMQQDEMAAGKPALQKQGAYVQQKKIEIQEEVNRQKLQYESNIAQADQQLEAQAMVIAKATPQPQMQQAQQVQTAVVAQNWSQNSSFKAPDESGEKAKEVDGKEVAGRKVYINDYVMNVQGVEKADRGQTYTGALNAPAGANKSAGSDNALPAKDEMQTQQVQDEIKQLQPANGNMAFAQAAVAMPPAMQQAQMQQAQNGDVVLNSARANSSKIAAGVADAGSAAAMPAAAAPASPQPAQTDNDGIGIGGAVRGNAVGLNAAAQLQKAGEISLPVDFPTEGRVYHFKKLKANADLTFWVTRPASLERFEWLLIFLVIAAAMKAIFKITDLGAWPFPRGRRG